MPRLLRFKGAMPRDPAVDRWLSTRPGELGGIARTWFAQVRECAGDIRELMHDGCPTACVEDAAFAYVNAYTAHVNIGFFQGVDLPDPERLLQGTGKYMRHVKLRPGAPCNADALRALLAAAHKDIVDRLARERRGRGDSLAGR